MDGDCQQVSPETGRVLEMIQRWLVMEAAPLIDRADTIKLVINIRGGDVQPIVEARFDPL